MIRRHDAEKLARLRDELTAKQGSARSLSDASRDAREESNGHIAEALHLVNVRSWDHTQHPDRLVAALELDAAALEGDARQASTLHHIERALVSARAAVAARATSDRVREQATRLQKETAALGALVRACDAWLLEQPIEA